MVSEWMENGNIRQYVAANPKVNRPAVLLGAADGLMYLHSRKLVHGDLKGANILIKQDGTSCLADFGFTTIMRTETCTFSSPTSGGTVRWMSPELLIPDEQSELPGRTVFSDCYAFGMVIYEVLTDKTPFYHITGPDYVVFTRLLQGERPDIPVDTPPAAHDSGLWKIVEQCWETEPIQRPALSEVRDQLATAAGMWATDLVQSTESYVDMAKDALFLPDSSDDDSDCDDEPEQEMSPYSFVQLSPHSTPERATTPVSVARGMIRNHSPRHSVAYPLGNGGRIRGPSRRDPARSLPEGLWGLQAYFYGPRQSLPVQRQSVVVLECVADDQSDAESEHHLEPPSYVYDKPKPPLVE